MMFRYYLCTFANRSNLFIHRHQIVKPDTDISCWCWCSDMISSSINRIECGRRPMESIENQQFSFIAIQFQLVYHHQCSISLIVRVKIWNAGSTPVSNSKHPFNGNQLDFTKWIYFNQRKTFQVEIWKMVSTVSKYPVWMTQKPRDFKELKFPKISRGAADWTPLRACTFGACFKGNRWVFILDPSLMLAGKMMDEFTTKDKQAGSHEYNTVQQQGYRLH